MVSDTEKQYPHIVCRNLIHFEPVLLPEESREAALAHLYQRLRTSAPRIAADDERCGRDVEQRQERLDENGSAGEQIAVMMAIHVVANYFGVSL